MDYKAVQNYLKENNLDGWLMVDFHGRNNIAIEFLNIIGMITRRWFCFIPSEGEPLLVHQAIEKDKFEHVDVRLIGFAGYKQLEQLLQDSLKGCTRIAMEYSPKGRLPYMGLVDAGTIELIRAFGWEIVTSAYLVAKFNVRLSEEQIADYHRAADNIIEIKDKAFKFIADSIIAEKTVTEYDVVQYILKQFDEYNMETEHDPNCSVNGNAGNPHYEPTVEGAAKIKRGDLILIDLWGKLKKPTGVYADITWMAYAGTANEIPFDYTETFQVLINARDTAIAYLKENLVKGDVYGADVDDACRAVIEQAGYGKQFVHRTGHSIASSVHGDGPNIDNLETEDKRKLQPGHLFSIEPGVYFDDYGFRTEIDVLVVEDGIEVVTIPLQTEIMALF